MNTPYLTQKPGWIARILLGITTLALVVVGFFFFTVALVAGALIALVIGVRLWWMMRKLKRAHADMQGSASTSYQPDQTNSAVVDGEYQVVERESGVEKLPPGHQGTQKPNDSDVPPVR